MDSDVIWQVVYQVAVVVVALLAGGASVELVRWLKGALGTNGSQTLVLVMGVALLLTLATMVAEAAIAPGMVTLENFGTVMVAVVVASQARYRMLRDELGDG